MSYNLLTILPLPFFPLLQGPRFGETGTAYYLDKPSSFSSPHSHYRCLILGWPPTYHNSYFITKTPGSCVSFYGQAERPHRHGSFVDYTIRRPFSSPKYFPTAQPPVNSTLGPTSLATAHHLFIIWAILLTEHYAIVPIHTVLITVSRILKTRISHAVHSNLSINCSAHRHDGQELG